MSLLDRGRETVEVWPAVEDVDEWGNAIIRPGDPSKDTPVVVTGCLVQPVTEDADLSQGYLMLSVYRVICRSWPSQGKAIARWRGQFWESKANPARRPYSRMTSHDTAILRAREEEMHDG